MSRDARTDTRNGSATINDVGLYGQEPEAGLLAAFISRLENRSVIDVGAERGSFIDAMLEAGSDLVHAIEPEPKNVAFLRKRFGSDERVTIHAVAASDGNATLELHLAVDSEGRPATFGHTVLDRPDTEEIAWPKSVTVGARSLSSLVAEGEVPSRIGVLKVDTEGHDLAVIAGMGALLCDVVMVEHWIDLPHSLGQCPWMVDDMVEVLGAKGFSHFAFIVHRGEFVTLQWDDGSLSPGAMGNLIFIHDRVLGDLLPEVIHHASSLSQAAVELAVSHTSAAEERLALIDELSAQRELHTTAIKELTAERDLQTLAAEERLEAMEELARRSQAVVEELARERDVLTEAATERLVSLQAAEEERDAQTKAAAERLGAIQELASEHEELLRTAEERRSELERLEKAGGESAIAELVKESELQAKAADERLLTIKELKRELELQAKAAEERRLLIEELTRERDLQTQAAEERLTAIKELTRERDLQARAAGERLATIERLSRESALAVEAAARRAEAMETLARKQIQGEGSDGWQ